MITPLLVLARSLHMGAAMLLVAIPYFHLAVWRPRLLPDEDGRDALLLRRMNRWLWVALSVELFSGAAWFWLVAAQMSDESPCSLEPATLQTVLWQTQFGELWMIRAALGLFLAIVLFFARHDHVPMQAGVLFLGACLLFSLAWAGHAASGTRHPVLHLSADGLHLLLGAVWPLGLIPLAGFLWNREARERDFAVLRRFSTFSLAAVLVLVATGIMNAWLMIGSWHAHVTTPYGEWLLLKILLVAIMIGLGAINRLYLLPRMPSSPACFVSLRRTVLAESLLALLVLGIVGIMGITPPPS
jgi:putative copper resistance protein D